MHSDCARSSTPSVSAFSQLHQRIVTSPLQVSLNIAVRKLVEGLKGRGNGVEWGLERVKEVLKQWMESCLSTVENELYSRMNQEIRRMVIKHREASMILRDINEKLILEAGT